MKTRTRGALTLLITVILAGALALFFTACGGDDEDGTSTSTTDGATNNVPAPEPYDGQIFYVSADPILGIYIKGDPVTTITSGTVKDRRQNNVNASDPNVYITVGTITNNKVAITLPATIDNSKLDNETGTYMGNFGSYVIEENSERIYLMCLSGEFAGDDLIFYSTGAINDLDYDDHKIDIEQGWNFFIQLFEANAPLIKINSFEEYFEKGFKWYLPSN